MFQDMQSEVVGERFVLKAMTYEIDEIDFAN